MKQRFLLSALTALILSPVFSVAQSAIVCPVNAGPDQTICVPNCATLTGTFTPTNATTSYAASLVPYAPDPYNVGTALVLSDDQWSGVIALPFTFCFYGTAYTSCLIGSNGLITFTTTTPNGYCQWPINTPVPTTANPMNTIMGPWQDLYPPGGGTIRYTTYGAAPCRRFVVSWNAVPMFACTTTLCTQQIVLYETTNIIDNYIQTKPLCANWNGGRAIQAIHNVNGTQAVVQAGRNSPVQWTVLNEGRRYTPSGANTYQIAWMQGATQVGNTASISVCPTTTTAYTFQVTYTNCNNTSVTISDQVIVNVSQLNLVGGGNVNICQGGNTVLSPTCPTCVNPPNWSWSPATGLSATNVQNPTASPTVTTVYTVTATDPIGGCTGTLTYTVTVTPMTTADAGLDDSICYNTAANLQASGGVNYSWAPSGSIASQTAGTGAATTIPLTSTTVFTVTVTDINGCIGTDQVTIYVPTQVLSVTTSETNASCNGICDGQSASTPAGGFGPYTYAWSSGGSGQTETNLCAGNYNLTVTDAIGCTATANMTITEPQPLVVTTSTLTAHCGQSDGSASITNITGGTPTYSIQWPSGNTGMNETNLASGTYCVIVTDLNGCQDSSCAIVYNAAGVTAQISGNTSVSCYNGCDGTAAVTGNGGNTPYTYLWPSGGTNPNESGLCAGNYCVTITDADGCQDTACVTITQPPQLVLNTPTANPASICIGQTSSLVATATGGTGAYTFSWSWPPANAQTGANITVTPSQTTTYDVSVADANGCPSGPLQVTVNVSQPLGVIASPNVTICQNNSTNLTAQGSGGNGTYTFTWIDPSGNIVGTGSPLSVTPSTTTTYYVIITDGCTVVPDTASVTVTIQNVPPVTFSAPVTNGCAPLCVTLSNTTAGTAVVGWDFGDNTTGTTDPVTHCFNVPGSYNITLTIQTPVGCQNTSTVNGYIQVYPNPTADFSASPQPTTLLNSEVTFTDLSLGATSWQWYFDESNDSVSILQNPSHDYSDTGYYNVQLIVSNSYGCFDTIVHPIVIAEDYAIYVPNTFTPNDDGINEIFIPQGIGIDLNSYHLMVFDRWGMLIFETFDPAKGWDGTYRGTKCQMDTYVWKITATDPFNSLHEYIGHVNLVR